MKIREWIYWAVLTGYCTAVFLLSLVNIILPLVLSLLPAMALFARRSSTHKAMVDYLSYNHPETWGRIAREQYNNRMRGPRDLIFVKDACDDPEYLELRKKHKKVFLTQSFLLGTSLLSTFYIRLFG